MDQKDNSDSSSSSSSENELTEDEEEINRDEIRKKVSDMSFEDLLKMKEQMGSKLYNATMYSSAANSKNETKQSFKRLNKNRPREMSSKKPVKTRNNVIPVKKVHVRDPRFDPLCGTFNERIFKNSYKFVNEIKAKERDELKKQLKNTEDSAEKQKLKLVIQKLENQLREQEKQEKKNEDLDKERAEIKEKIKKGEKVHYKTKSERKIEGLVSKYEELKKTNKLQKYIEKKSRKNAKQKPKFLQT